MIVNYEGRFINGKIFDSSYQQGKTANFCLLKVIVGWSEALQMMQENSIWEIYVPANLAYKEKGTRGIIGPNEALIFKVHLIKVLQ